MEKYEELRLVLIFLVCVLVQWFLFEQNAWEVRRFVLLDFLSSIPRDAARFLVGSTRSIDHLIYILIVLNSFVLALIAAIFRAGKPVVD